MHEMALAESVLDITLEAAQAEGAKRVKAIYLTIGTARDVVEDMFEGLLLHLAKGTIAEGASIVIFNPPLSGRCGSCLKIFPVSIYERGTIACPYCGSSHYSLNTGLEFRIDRLELEQLFLGARSGLRDAICGAS